MATDVTGGQVALVAAFFLMEFAAVRVPYRRGHVLAPHLDARHQGCVKCMLQSLPAE